MEARLGKDLFGRSVLISSEKYALNLGSRSALESSEKCALNIGLFVWQKLSSALAALKSLLHIAVAKNSCIALFNAKNLLKIADVKVFLILDDQISDLLMMNVENALTKPNRFLT